MAVEILWDPDKQIAAFWDNTVDLAFGPVFSGPSADTEAQEFLDWYASNNPAQTDVRTLSDARLRQAVDFWCEQPTVSTDG